MKPGGSTVGAIAAPVAVVGVTAIVIGLANAFESINDTPEGPGSGEEIDLSEPEGPGSGEEEAAEPPGPGSGRNSTRTTSEAWPEVPATRFLRTARGSSTSVRLGPM
jgi:hypothetical protein